MPLGGVAVKSNEYDERYLAMFQPGGANRPFEAGPPGTGPEALVHTHDPAPAAVPAAVPLMASTAGHQEHTFNHRATAWGLGAALLTLLTGVGCLLTGALVPSALAFTLDPLQGMHGTPWGMTLAVAAAPLITAALAAMAVILMLAARQHQAPVPVLRRSTTILGVATLALAAVLLFNDNLFPIAMWWGPESSSYPPAQIWNVFASTGELPLTTLGLAILLVVLLDQPHDGRGRMAGKSIPAGGLLLAASFIMNFATHLFPHVEGSQIRQAGGAFAQTPPWTYAIATAANAGILVGAAALLLGIALTFMPRHEVRPDAEQDPAAEGDAAAVS